MAIRIISKLAQKNDMTFKIVDAKDVSYDGSEDVSIKDKVDELLQSSLKPDIILNDQEPEDQKVGGFWLQKII